LKILAYLHQEGANYVEIIPITLMAFSYYRKILLKHMEILHYTLLKLQEKVKWGLNLLG
jgi:hypothetical protein